MKTVIRTDALMVPIAHFSHGLRVGDEIHLGATAGTDANRRLVDAQADRMYRNMKLALELLGGSLQDVVRIKTWVTDWRDLPACEEAFGEHFRAPHPSRAIVGSWGFPLPHAVIEAELTAVVGRSSTSHIALGGEDFKQTLARLGSLVNLRDVVKTTVTLADIRDYASFEAQYMQSFKPPYPARTVTMAPLSEPAQRVQIEAVTFAGGGKPVGRQLGAAMLAGSHLYIGGQVGSEERGAEAQARAAWRRILAILEEAGMQAADVLRTNNWLTDWRSYQAFNAGYGAFVEAPYPPRATVIGGLLDPRALVQIEAEAHREGRSATVLESNT